jgi:hypothetical protein
MNCFHKRSDFQSNVLWWYKEEVLEDRERHVGPEKGTE